MSIEMNCLALSGRCEEFFIGFSHILPNVAEANSVTSFSYPAIVLMPSRLCRLKFLNSTIVREQLQ
jgi:hypothetical protein